MNKRDAKRVVARAVLGSLRKQEAELFSSFVTEGEALGARENHLDGLRLRQSHDELIKLLEDRTKATHSSGIRW